jgi:membrane protease YdiL (CAAX protease family)
MATLGRLRRTYLFPPVQALVAVFWIAIAMATAESVARAFFPSSSPLVTLALVPGALIGYYTFVRVIERRSAPELLSSGSTQELLAGLTFGAALMSLVMGALYIAGAYSASGFNRLAAAIPALVAALMAGVTEELLIRAAVFRIIERWLGSWLALGLTAGLFGVMHIPNPNSTAFSTLSVAVGGGLMLCAAFMVTRRIWFAMGTHIAWNFFQGGVFGVATSGVATEGLLKGSLHGPTYLTGGQFGPESSVVALIVCALAALSLLTFAWRKGQFLRPHGWPLARSRIDALPFARAESHRHPA